MKRRITSLNHILNILLRLGILILLARHFGPERFGIIIFFTIFFTAFLILDKIWIRPRLMHEINKNKPDNILINRIIMGNGIIIRVLLSMIIIISLWVHTLIINHPLITRLSVFASIKILLIALYSSFRINAEFNKKRYYHISPLLLKKTLIFLLIYLILFFTKTLFSLYKLVLMLFFLIVLWSAIQSMKIGRPSFKIDFELWKKVGKDFQSLGLVAIFIFIYLNIDYLILLFYTKSFGKLGLYGAAINFIESLGTFLVPLIISISPLKLRYLRSLNRAFRLTCKYFLIIMPFAVIITIFSKTIISAVYGKQFLTIVPAVSILIWAEVIVFIRVVKSYLSFSQRSRLMNFIFMGAAILINVSLNLILIPRYSFYGVAIATLISYCIWPNNKLLYINYTSSYD